MKRWKFWEESGCHSCDEQVEDADHILYCPHEDRYNAWQEAVAGFEAWMMEADTDPSIQSCIVAALQARDPHTTFSTYVDSPHIQAAAEEQDQIGWSHFIKGRVSKQWRAIQEEHYRSIGSKRTARSWTEGLVSNILTLVHKQWIARNAVVHARDAKGLKVREGKELALAIDAQFSLDVDGLLPQDRHLITRGRQSVNEMMATGQKTWLQSIQIAREVYESEIESETTQLRNSIYSWMNGCITSYLASPISGLRHKQD